MLREYGIYSQVRLTRVRVLSYIGFSISILVEKYLINMSLFNRTIRFSLLYLEMSRDSAGQFPLSDDLMVPRYVVCRTLDKQVRI